MALVMNRRQVGVENTSKPVGIADDPIARLMYYLNCMCNVLSLSEPNLNRLTDYNQYNMLSDEDKLVLILLCANLNPLVLTGKCLIHDEDVESVSGRDNEFFSLNETSMTFAAVESVIVGEKRVAVKEIMVYNTRWINRNYLEPMKYFLDDDNEVDPMRVSTTMQAIAYNQRPAISYAHDYDDHQSITSYKEGCCCIIL